MAFERGLNELIAVGEGSIDPHRLVLAMRYYECIVDHLPSLPPKEGGVRRMAASQPRNLRVLPVKPHPVSGRGCAKAVADRVERQHRMTGAPMSDRGNPPGCQGPRDSADRRSTSERLAPAH